MNNDYLVNPKHYKSAKGLECIDCIEGVVEGLTGIEATDTGNIMKYLWRWKNKDGVNDLKKAQWYINHLIAHVENDTEKLKTMEEILIDKQLDELHDED
jgi:hypothetical protein|tara:strand:+ start:1021 stop:1317 length:297 start_codon:yes stop_codon:yes gene_type:complete